MKAKKGYCHADKSGSLSLPTPSVKGNDADMKRCPSCNQSFSDDTLSFCLNDGAPLLSVSEPRRDSAQTTEVYRPSQPGNDPYAPTPGWSPGPSGESPQRSSALPWVIGSIVAVVLLGIGVVVIAAVIMIMLKASNTNNSNNSNYAADNQNRNYNANSSNENAGQQSTPAKTLDVAGIWNGSSDGSPATLVIRRSEDNSYEGVETAGEFKDEMLVKVEVSPATRRIIIKEVRKLKGDNWSMGTNEGTISSDGRSMSGMAKDAKGKSYAWSFTRK